jgi:methylaspartate mutase epsilon subunit
MKVAVKQDMLTQKEFFEERTVVTNQWPTGQDIDLTEAIEYHQGLSESRSFFKVVELLKREGRTVNFPRGGTPTIEGQIELNRRMVEAGVPLIPITTDSYTRNGDFMSAQKGLDASLKTGISKLNGFPLVNHGVSNTRRVLEANEAAYCARFNGADNRLLADVALASGMTSVLLDPFEVFGSYTKKATVEECIRNYQYTYRLAGYYTERGSTITPDLIGWLPNGVFPYTIGLVCQIVATLIAAAQGVKSITPNVQTQGNLAQDVAGMRSVRKLMRKYLDEYGFKDFVIPGVFAAPVPIFPSPEKEHTALTYMVYSAVIASIGEAEAIVSRTVDEAAGIPTADAHSVTYESTNWVFSVLRPQKIKIDDEAIRIEEELIEQETDAIMNAIMNLGEGDVTVGFVKAVEMGYVDSPMSPNIHSKDQVLGIRDVKGAARYLEFGNLPFEESVKKFHREKVKERSTIERRNMDYKVSIEDFWAISKGRLIGSP